MFTITIDVRNRNGQTPLDKVLDYFTLFETSSEDFPDVALYLIDCGCPEGNGDKAKILRAACRWGKLDMLKELIEQFKVDPKGNLYTCTHAVNGHATSSGEICTIMQKIMCDKSHRYSSSHKLVVAIIVTG